MFGLPWHAKQVQVSAGPGYFAYMGKNKLKVLCLKTLAEVLLLINIIMVWLGNIKTNKLAFDWLKALPGARITCRFRLQSLLHLFLLVDDTTQKFWFNPWFYSNRFKFRYCFLWAKRTFNTSRCLRYEPSVYVIFWLRVHCEKSW